MSGDEWQVLRFTLLMATAATLCILPPGLALAWILARKKFFGKSVVETLVALPLVLPPVATGLILLRMLGRNGPLGSWLWNTFDIEIVFTWKAVVIALSVMSFPLLVRMARTAFEEVERAQEEVALTLGARPWKAWWFVTLPLARRGILAGTLMAFTRAFGEFGATILVAGNIPGKTQTLALAIYQDIQLGDDLPAFRLLTASVILAFIAIWFCERLAAPRSSKL